LSCLCAPPRRQIVKIFDTRMARFQGSNLRPLRRERRDLRDRGQDAERAGRLPLTTDGRWPVPLARNGRFGEPKPARALSERRAALEKADRQVWVGSGRPRTWAVRSLNLGASFPPMSSLARPALADPLLSYRFVGSWRCDVGSGRPTLAKAICGDCDSDQWPRSTTASRLEPEEPPRTTLHARRGLVELGLHTIARPTLPLLTSRGLRPRRELPR
jgi:hypothetical protein